jgi:NAD(P) transhydrogenase subunit beta
MEATLQISYLIASVTFIMGLKMLSSPETARRGNLIAAFGMALAIVATIIFHKKDGHSIGNIPWIIAAMGVGTVIGWLMAMKVKMTGMPQMVSFFNGMGGACAALISLIEYQTHGGEHPDAGFLVVLLLGLIIGAVSFSGSMIAYGKLEGKVKDLTSNAMPIVNGIMFFLVFGLAAWGVFNPTMLDEGLLWGILAISLVYGILFVMPIGGADMPVVISLLNSFTGVAAAFGGFLYDNPVMLTGGILVGSAGTILTVLMCKAMNRSLLNVIIGSFTAKGGPGGDSGEKVVKEISVTDLAILCAYAQKVVIVPGYGLAVAQAQHTCHEFEKILTEKGVDVSFAIHPVAGRMPGHMNVLLAEADVSYDKLLELEDANDGIANADVAIVVGANDVVNPAAEDDPSSSIYGMPIIQVYKAKQVVVMKRSMGKGYAGIENNLFFAKNTSMLFGDAKKSPSTIVSELRGL